MVDISNKATFQDNNFETAKDEYFDLRCKSCDKLLAKLNPQDARLDLRCHRCGGINSVSYGTDQQVYLTDNVGKILYVNEQVEQITGYSAEEVLGKTPAIWGRQMPQDFYRKLWKDILEKKETVVVHIVNRRKNGQLYKARTSIFPILNEKGKVSHFLGIQTVTEKIGELLD